MIQFVNAKINIGLNIVRRRPDGYHDLETIFYPVGVHNGTPANPDPFCDILEITPSQSDVFEWRGRHIDCRDEDNLVCRAVKVFREAYPCGPVKVTLEKYLPDGAGLGGGSADASFTLRMLNELNGNPLTDDALERLALRLGADCPVFIANRPAFAEGVGERLFAIEDVLRDRWCVIVKPDLYVSTREAFAGVTPRKPEVKLSEIVKLPITEWKHLIHNDFETSLFPHHPELLKIKETLYSLDSLYSSMSGSGSSLYGIFAGENAARQAESHFRRLGLSVFVALL